MKKASKRLCALLLSVMVLLGSAVSTTVFATEGEGAEQATCKHTHDEFCGYVEGTDCTHAHGDACGENGENCTHNHDEECGYIEAAPCEHICDEDCGGLIFSQSMDEENGGSPTLVAVASLDPLPDEVLWQGYDAGAVADATGLTLPDTLTGKDETDAPLTIGDVTWACTAAGSIAGEPFETAAFDPAAEGKYTFTAKLPEGYTLAEDVTLPEICVTVRPAGGVDIAPMSVGIQPGVGTVTSGLTGTPLANTTTIEFGGRQWVVIGNGGTGVYSSNGTMTLLFANGQGYSGSAFGSNNQYGGSTHKEKIENVYNDLIGSGREAALVIPRRLEGGSGNQGAGDYDADKIAGAAVESANFWPLSVYEANQLDISVREFGDTWLLRSPGLYSDFAAYVDYVGSVGAPGFDVDYYFAIRPAFSLNLESVLFTSDASGASVKSSATVGSGLSPAQPVAQNLKLTVLDAGQVLDVYGLTSGSGTSTLTFSYDAATITTGSSRYLSCILTDGSGNVAYYGKLEDLASTASGTVDVPLTGVNDGTYTLKIFTEEVREKTTHSSYTDFASTPFEIEIEVTSGNGSPTDATKPAVSAVTPADGATDVAVGDDIAITFSEAMNPATGLGEVKLNNGTALTGGVWSSGNTVYTVPYSGLANNTVYTIGISGFQDVAGNEMNADNSNSFTSAPDTTKPTVSSVTPADSATGIAVGGNIVVTFSEAMNTTPGTVALTGGTNTVNTSGTWSNGNKTYTIGYSGLEYSKTYAINISGFKDVAGNTMDAVTSGYSFTTVAQGVTTYTLTVNSGTGGGNYAAGIPVTITANAPAAGNVFDKWVITSGSGSFANANSASTTFTMPAGNATVTATYKADGGGHTHSYSTSWTSDATHHWHACSCGDKADVALHTENAGVVTQQPTASQTGVRTYSCTVCGYVLRTESIPATGDDSSPSSSDDSSSSSTPDTYTRRTLRHEATGVTLTGSFTADATLTVTEKALHPAGTCAACDEIRARQAAGELIVLYDISISGNHTGELEVGIPVGDQFNGQTVTILHCVNGALESVTCTVQNGKATGIFKKLSPFAVIANSSENHNPDTGGLPDDKGAEVPQTGDGSTMDGWIALLVAALLLAACAGYMVWRRKHHAEG